MNQLDNYIKTMPSDSFYKSRPPYEDSCNSVQTLRDESENYELPCILERNDAHCYVTAWPSTDSLTKFKSSTRTSVKLQLLYHDYVQKYESSGIKKVEIVNESGISDEFSLYELSFVKNYRVGSETKIKLRRCLRSLRKLSSGVIGNYRKLLRKSEADRKM